MGVEDVAHDAGQRELVAVVERRDVDAPSLLPLHRGAGDPRTPPLLEELVAHGLGARLLGERAHLDDGAEGLLERVGRGLERFGARGLLRGADPGPRALARRVAAGERDREQDEERRGAADHAPSPSAA